MAVDLNYGIGVEGKNLVLKTLGRVYVKVKDRKYELAFRPEDIIDQIKQYGGSSTASESTGNFGILIVEDSAAIDTVEYPGDNVFVITKDGQMYYTENNGFTQINVQFTGSEMTLENLFISGQITFTGNGIPLIIPNTNLISNLNADLLDGYHANSFGIKGQNETINGNWKFSNTLTFNDAFCQGKLEDSNGGNRIWIDFSNGNIRCNTLTANEINIPAESILPDLVSGIGNEVWVGSEIGIIESNIISDFDPDEDINKFSLISDSLNDGYLPDVPNEDSEIEWNENFWYDIFFSTYDSDEETYTPRDFTNPTEVEYANNQLAPNYTINDFNSLVWAYQEPNMSAFTGDYYDIQIGEDIDTQLLLPNMIVKDNRGNIGIVVNRSGNYVTIRLQNENISISGTKLIVIGNLANPGGIVFQANAPSLSIVKDPLNPTDVSVYFGNLSKIDNTKSGIGIILSGTYPTNIVQDNTLDSLRNYQHTSEINIENSYLKWGDNITIFNEDGSGYLSKGQIRWSSNNDLIVEGSDITNSRINNTTITNSSFQSGNILINTNGSGNIGNLIEFDTTQVTKNSPLGPADGDLTGNYPNPTIKDGVITESKLDITLLNRITDLESKVAELETKNSELETKITDLETYYKALEYRVSALEIGA